MHSRRMSETRNTLDGASPIEETGLRRLVDFLDRQKVIGKIEKDFLYELISRIFSAKNIEGLQSTLQEFLKKLGEKAHDLVAAVAGVAQSSAEYVKSIPQAQWDRATRIVATDLSGALSGAGTGSKWGTSGAVIGAAIGAVSTSITAAYAKS